MSADIANARESVDRASACVLVDMCVPVWQHTCVCLCVSRQDACTCLSREGETCLCVSRHVCACVSVDLRVPVC